MGTAGLKILIVDDSVFNLEVLSLILKSGHDEATEEPYTILTAGSGLEALEKAQTQRPDIILLDIIMPGMDGFEVLVKLKESDVTWAVPVIIISGLTGEDDEEKALMLGAVDYITKPFRKSIVLARIKTHLKIVAQMRIIEQLSLVDTLTNIPNRRNFDSHITEEWGRAVREKTPVSVLMIDVDHFKVFNDTYGHQQGDVTLKAVAGAIKSVPRRSSDLAARWGGEEFTVLLPNTPLSGAIHTAEKIRACVENTLIERLDGGAPLNVTVSVGVSTKAPAAGDMLEDILKHADEAMYCAKQTGRNKVCAYGIA